MKFLVAIGLCLAIPFGSGQAQTVSAEIVFDQEQYLVGEPVIAKVRVTNFSGQTLELGTDNQWLTFQVEGERNYIVSRKTPPEVEGAFKLETANIGTRRIDLAPSFDLSRPGHYTVTAAVRFAQLEQLVRTKPQAFDMIAGNRIWEQDFGVPNLAKDGTPEGSPELRKYALIQTSQHKNMRLYFRLSDASGGHVYRIFPLGPVVSFSTPDAQLDKFNNLHVLYQVGGRAFLYCLISPDGLLLTRETHDYQTTRPALRPTQDRRVLLTGGTRRMTASDLPPSISTRETNDANAIQP